jgi:hypothetical protein
MVVSSPAIVDGVAYVGSYDHLVYAIGVPSEGTNQQDMIQVIVVVLSVVAVLIVVAALVVLFHRRKQ